MIFFLLITSDDGLFEFQDFFKHNDFKDANLVLTKVLSFESGI